MMLLTRLIGSGSKCIYDIRRKFGKRDLDEIFYLEDKIAQDAWESTRLSPSSPIYCCEPFYSEREVDHRVAQSGSATYWHARRLRVGRRRKGGDPPFRDVNGMLLRLLSFGGTAHL